MKEYRVFHSGSDAAERDAQRKGFHAQKSAEQNLQRQKKFLAEANNQAGYEGIAPVSDSAHEKGESQPDCSGLSPAVGSVLVGIGCILLGRAITEIEISKVDSPSSGSSDV